MMCENTEVKIWIGQLLGWSGCFHKQFSRTPQTPLSCASCRGNPTEPLDCWRMRGTPTVAIEVISWCRTCLPIANELGKQPARWKPPCISGTATQHCTFHGAATAWCNTADWESKTVERLQWVASFTVTQCHMHCRGFTILSAAYLFHLKKQPRSHELDS